MRKVLTVAALALALAAPVSAEAFPHFGGGGHFGGHGGGFGGGHCFHHGWGWGAAGLGLGLGVLAIESSCYRERPVYDADGEIVGSRTVNVCY